MNLIIVISPFSQAIAAAIPCEFLDDMGLIDALNEGFIALESSLNGERDYSDEDFSNYMFCKLSFVVEGSAEDLGDKSYTKKFTRNHFAKKLQALGQDIQGDPKFTPSTGDIKMFWMLVKVYDDTVSRWHEYQNFLEELHEAVGGDLDLLLQTHDEWHQMALRLGDIRNHIVQDKTICEMVRDGCATNCDDCPSSSVDVRVVQSKGEYEKDNSHGFDPRRN